MSKLLKYKIKDGWINKEIKECGDKCKFYYNNDWGSHCNLQKYETNIYPWIRFKTCPLDDFNKEDNNDNDNDK